VYAYQRSATALPNTSDPGEVVYTFGSKSITSPATLANGWSRTIPAGTDPCYVVVATAYSSTGTDTIAATEWTDPVVLAQNGAAGGPGAAGPRGSRTLYSTNAYYSSYHTTHDYLGNVVAPFAANCAFHQYAENEIQTATGTNSIKGDTLVFTNANDYTYTCTKGAAEWVPPGTILDGDLLVTGSITTTKIRANAITAEKLSVTAIDINGNVANGHIGTLRIEGNAVTVPMNCSGGNKQVFVSNGVKADYPPFTGTQLTLKVFSSYDPNWQATFTYLDAGFLTAMLIMQCSTEAERVNLSGVGIGSSGGCRARGRARLVRYIETGSVPFVAGMLTDALLPVVNTGYPLPIGTKLNVGTIFDTWVSVGSDYMNQFSAAGSIAILTPGYYGVTFDLGNNWDSGNWQLPVLAQAVILGSRR
jgi:hypothetical protein